LASIGDILGQYCASKLLGFLPTLQIIFIYLRVRFSSLSICHARVWKRDSILQSDSTETTRRDDFVFVVGSWYRSAFHELPGKKDARRRRRARNSSLSFNPLLGKTTPVIFLARTCRMWRLSRHEVDVLTRFMWVCGKLVDVIGNTHKDGYVRAALQEKISLPLLHPSGITVLASFGTNLWVFYKHYFWLFLLQREKKR